MAKLPSQVVNFFKGQGIDPLPFEEEQRRQAQARMADHDLGDRRFQDQYFRDMREDFIRGLLNHGIKETTIRTFLAEKGAYTHDLNLISHSITLGTRYEKPKIFAPDPTQILYH